MNKGKVTCEVLKEIRKQIADQNGIDYQTRECTFEGECRGTCSVCESEIHYLESEIVKKKYLGKAVILAGLSVGLISGLTGCGHETQKKVTNNTTNNVQDIEDDFRIGGDYSYKDTLNKTPNDSSNSTKNNTNLGTYEGFLGVEKDPFSNDIIFDTTELIMDEVLGDIPPPRGMIESMPEFPGGNDSLKNYITKELRYPESCRRDSISGIVLIEFIIEKDGSISDVSPLIRVHPDLDAEAVRVIKNMPKWIPSEVRGIPQRTFNQIPIRFNLQ